MYSRLTELIPILQLEKPLQVNLWDRSDDTSGSGRAELEDHLE
ncbi:hypothetical protein A2U01_0083442, partial [Trifolium medium]|nr:hypothetical protein [Trifolium medium]